MLVANEVESASSHVDGASIHDRPCKHGRLGPVCSVHLMDGQTFSKLLDARKQQMDTALASATVISWACINTVWIQTHDSIGEETEGFVRVFPENLSTDAGEIVEVGFEEVKPGPGKYYKCHLTIRIFLEETKLDPLVSDKRKRVDYLGSSTSFLWKIC
jgi:hypothetical protein